LFNHGHHHDEDSDHHGGDGEECLTSASLFLANHDEFAEKVVTLSPDSETIRL